MGFIMNHWIALLNTVMSAPDQVSEASYEFILKRSFPNTVKTYLRTFVSPFSQAFQASLYACRLSHPLLLSCALQHL